MTKCDDAIHYQPQLWLLHGHWKNLQGMSTRLQQTVMLDLTISTATPTVEETVQTDSNTRQRAATRISTVTKKGDV
jgi:hypothetical protein